ncbi:hypothetical protein CONLIGDRAFT_676734 [Coniochaeta ligniaria NRRL 30616]|uniref:Uncharacterized protein n=1 Tax=Coniochaeta ligniaria NRRL 30616 TaxID=1408157 RepID=A0A1J7IZJ3_9PEZI|nr:hypothetical protein CONLIGDRAFT_676734 [Coniochaeta ligniaria NRRL 30616]
MYVLLHSYSVLVRYCPHRQNLMFQSTILLISAGIVDVAFIVYMIHEILSLRKQIRAEFTMTTLTIFTLAMASLAKAEETKETNPAPSNNFNLKTWDYAWMGVAAGATGTILLVSAYSWIKHRITKKRKQKEEADIELATQVVDSSGRIVGRLPTTN